MGKSAEWEQLYAAIGRVAAQSAQNDDHMREVFFAILWSDSAWILAEGQPTEWLCSTLPVLLHLEDSGYERWPRAMHDEVIGAIKQIKSLHAHRNTIIHSTWRKGLIEREEDTVTRPWGKRDDQVPWAAFRSRQRVYAPAFRMDDLRHRATGRQDD